MTAQALSLVADPATYYRRIAETVNQIITDPAATALLVSNNTWTGFNTWTQPATVNTSAIPPYLTVEGTGVSTGYHHPALLVSAPSTGTAAGIWAYSSANTIFQGLLLENTLNGSTASVLLEMVNDTIGHEMYLFHTSSSFSSGIGFTNFSGSPMSGMCSLFNPIVIGAGARAALLVATTGAISTFAPTGSSTAFTVNAASTGQGLAVAGIAGTTAGSDVFVGRTSSFANTIGTGPNIQLQDTGAVTATQLQQSGGQTELWQYNGAWVQIMRVTAAHAIQGLGPVAAAMVDMTPDTSSWTSTLSGPWVAGSNPSGTIKWNRMGKIVNLWVDSNITQTATIAATISCSGVPASIIPSSTRSMACTSLLNNGSGDVMGQATVTSTGVILLASQTGPFVGAGTTGVGSTWSVTYSL